MNSLLKQNKKNQMVEKKKIILKEILLTEFSG